MSLQPDSWIASQALEHKLLYPFVPRQVRSEQGRAVISYGLSSFGYDIRLAGEFRVFTNIRNSVVDPKDFDRRGLVQVRCRRGAAGGCIIPPNSFVLGLSLERFRLPRHVLALCVGKSTYARCGILVNVTPFEPGWHGRAVIEISNTTPLPARVYPYEGIAQVLFFAGAKPCEISYADRRGKYQGQRKITLPRA